MNDAAPPCFAFLGLRPDADARAIKRAYASLLKTTRPDDDPTGFQTLHGHYQTALAYVAWRARQALEVEQAPGSAEDRQAADTTSMPLPPHAALAADDAATPPPQAAPERPRHAQDHAPTAATGVDEALPAATAASLATAPAATPDYGARELTFDLGAFYAALLREASQRDADALTQWLRAEPALWSFALKSEVGARILHQFFETAPPMGAAQFDAVLAFFDLDHVFAVRDPLAVENLRDAMATRADLANADPMPLELRMKRVGNFHGSETARILTALKRPWSYPRGFIEALIPGAAGVYARFIRSLSRGHLALLSPPIDPRWPRFWLRASGATGVTRAYAAIGVARCLLVAAILAIPGLLTYSKEPRQTGGMDFLVLALLAVFVAFGWLYYLLVALVISWQGMRQSDPPGWPRRLRALFVPLLCACCTLTLLALADADRGLRAFIGVLLPATTLVVAVRRYRMRAASPSMRWIFDLRLIILPLIFGGTFISSVIANASKSRTFENVDAVDVAMTLMLAVAFCTWLADLWKQRRGFKQARGQAEA